jgi:hypothetical protein
MKAVTMVVFLDEPNAMYDRPDGTTVDKFTDEEAFEAAYVKIADDQPDLFFVDEYEGPIPSAENQKFFTGWQAGTALRFE